MLFKKMFGFLVCVGFLAFARGDSLFDLGNLFTIFVPINFRSWRLKDVLFKSKLQRNS